MCDDNERSAEGHYERTNEKTRNSRPSRRRRSNQTEHKEKPSTQGGISKQTNERMNVEDEAEEEQTKCSKRSVCVRLLLLLDEAEICAQLVEEEQEWEDPAVTEFEHRKQT